MAEEQGHSSHKSGRITLKGLRILKIIDLTRDRVRLSRRRY